ncbi:MAG: hypothetical protein GDA56_11980 [Hormoscilla sp. GM7CHS1pb]|nr:hypothetical protein [Hormoscilla sp. GM7CHS1pb]
MTNDLYLCLTIGRCHDREIMLWKKMPDRIGNHLEKMLCGDLSAFWAQRREITHKYSGFLAEGPSN